MVVLWCLKDPVSQTSTSSLPATLWTCSTLQAEILATTAEVPSSMRFEVLGDGIFNSDSQKYDWAILHSLFKNESFGRFLQQIIQKKLESCLLPFLNHASKTGVQVDLQDIFQRFTFDNNICSVVLGFDPNFLPNKFISSSRRLLMRKPSTKWRMQSSTDTLFQDVYGSCRNGSKLDRRRSSMSPKKWLTNSCINV